MERGRPLDGVYFLRTNGQRPWSYASYGELFRGLIHKKVPGVSNISFDSFRCLYTNVLVLIADTCNPPCDEGFTCDDGQCLCGSYNGTVCSGQTPSCLTSSNYTVGYDLSSRCRACVKQRFTISTKLVQGSCPSSDYVCLDDGSCRFGKVLTNKSPYLKYIIIFWGLFRPSF